MLENVANIKRVVLAWGIVDLRKGISVTDTNKTHSKRVLCFCFAVIVAAE